MHKIELDLEQLFKQAISETGLELSLNADKAADLIVLSGNKAGLLLVALDCIKLAMSDSPGQHFHFDEASNLSSTNASLIIQKTN